MGLWILYVCLHSIMAAIWFKRMVKQLMGKHFNYYRLIYSCIAATTLIIIIIFQYSHPSILLFKPGWLLIGFGIIFSLAGLFVMIACIRKYFLNLSGIDVLLNQQSSPVLEKGGMHRHVRHPLYSGTLLCTWALFLLFPLLSNFIASAIITVYTLIGIRIEEQKLLLEFGDDYKVYALKTPMLIPFLKKKFSDL